MSISPNMPEMATQAETGLNTAQNAIETMGQHITLGPGGVPGNFNGVAHSGLDFQTGKVLADDFLSPDLALGLLIWILDVPTLFASSSIC